MIQPLLVFSLLVTLAVGVFPPKHLAGPPEEFVYHRIPKPDETLTIERSASDFIWFKPTNNNNDIVYTTTVPVDGQEFVFTFSSPLENELELELIDPSGKVVDLTPFTRPGEIPIGDSIVIPTTSYIVENSVRGYYTLNIKSLSTLNVTALSVSPYPNAVLTVINDDDLEIESHMSSYLIKQGQEFGIISTIVDPDPEYAISNIRVTSALMEVITPDGEDIEIQMTDDDSSLTAFGIPPHSGAYGARFVTKTAGQYIVQAKLQGLFTDETSNEVIPFLRSTEHVMDVSAATVELTGVANLRPLDKEHVLIDIGTSGNGDQLRAYAEVWGVDSTSKTPKAACWIGGFVQIANNFVTLELDTNWLKLAGVNGPLTLKNVYVSDLQTSFPVAISSNDMPVKNSASLKIQKSQTPIQITKEMRYGVNPLRERYLAMRNVSADKPNLVLLPGYCSKSNPWQGNQNDFTSGSFYSYGGGNLRNHEFAQRVMSHVEELDLPSFSIIGHSQGGMIALHIHNYFFTGLEMSTAGRIVQSVGTPFKGCTAAGALAGLGQIFGIGCGSNTDLSLDGAINWLNGISLEARADVHLYTTTYKQGTFFGDYCNLAMNLVLQWPNDGTTEIKFAILEGGKYLGNVEKWCHTTSMSYPPQYTDSARNAEMNREAAR